MNRVKTKAKDEKRHASAGATMVSATAEEPSQDFALGVRHGNYFIGKGWLTHADLVEITDRYADWLVCSDGFLAQWLYDEDMGLDEFWREAFKLNPELEETDGYGRLLQPGIDFVTGVMDAFRRRRNASTDGK